MDDFLSALDKHSPDSNCLLVLSELRVWRKKHNRFIWFSIRMLESIVTIEK